MTGNEKNPVPRRIAEIAVPPGRSRREITSEELFGAGREVGIRHADEVYTLRRTNKGKLILTK